MRERVSPVREKAGAGRRREGALPPGTPEGAEGRGVLREEAEKDRIRTRVSRETYVRFETYIGLLERWSSVLNLVSAADRRRLWSRHVADSLELLPLLAPRRPPLLDIGSGAGFPGVVLAIALGWPVTLAERDQRKAAFLREVAHHLALPLEIHAAPVETLARPCYNVITARAVAPLGRLLAWSRPNLAPGGVLAFFKKEDDLKELDTLTLPPTARLQIHPNRVRPGGRLLLIEGLVPAAEGGTA